MTDKPDPPIPDPDTDPAYSQPGLPPNPSVGELVTEIDRARTSAARTAGELLEKVDVRQRIQHTAREQTDRLRRIGPQLAGALTALFGLLWLSRRRKRKRSKNPT